MKNPIFIFLLLLLGFSNCQDKHEVAPDCLNEMLEAFDMQPYNGEEIGCEMHLMEFELNDELIYLLNNHCADMVFNPINCRGEALCDNPSQYDCDAFGEEAIFTKVVGISIQ